MDNAPNAMQRTTVFMQYGGLKTSEDLKGMNANATYMAAKDLSPTLVSGSSPINCGTIISTNFEAVQRSLLSC